MKPQGITYKIRNGVNYFKLPEHLKPSNENLIRHLCYFPLTTMILEKWGAEVEYNIKNL